MAKMSKSALKLLIKECIVEVLQEGLGFDGELVERAERQPRRIRSAEASLSNSGRRSSQPNHPVLDAPAARRESAPSLSSRISNTIANVSSDPTLQALLEDTAQSTLRNQDSAETSRGPTAQSDVPMDTLSMLGAKTSTWEALAFTNLPDPSKIKLESS